MSSNPMIETSSGKNFDLFLIQDFHETPFMVDAGGCVFTSGENSWPLVIRIQVLVPVDNEQHHFLTQFLELATHNI